MTVQGVLRQPFAEQVAFFRGKLGNLIPTDRWDDIQRSAHDRGFMVAGAGKADLLSDLVMAVERTQSEGKSLDAFREDFRDIVARNGWTGWTGEGTKGGEAWRTRVIYRTNAATAYAAGRRAQLEAFPLWVYKHSGSENPRPSHLALDGVVLPKDDPFWATHFPPNDFGCDCKVAGARDERTARHLGGEPGKALPKGWEDAAGEGWDYAPGASVVDDVAVMAEKTRAWDYEIAKAFMESLPPAQADRLVTSYRALPSVAADVRRYAARVLRGDAPPQKYRTLGLLTTGQAGTITALKGVDVSRFDFALDISAVKHVHRAHGSEVQEAQRGQRAVVTSDYARLPALLTHGDLTDVEGSSRAGEPLLQIRGTVGSEQHVTTWAIRRGRRMLALQSMWIGTSPR